jgi:ribosome-binding ATPase YchF (GTP1/OBG family)
MRIAFTAFDHLEGKIKYNDPRLKALAEKDQPKKVSPFFANFLRDDFVTADAIIIPSAAILDLLILDLDKIETRLERMESGAESELLRRCQALLEEEVPLCDAGLNSAEVSLLATTSPLSLKPVVRINGDEDSDTLIELALAKAGLMFFYTSGPTESHAWLVPQNASIVTCAGAIHSDLARGFIKGDVVSFDDYLAHHNFKECISKGVSKLVDRDYLVQPGEVIEIRFSV